MAWSPDADELFPSTCTLTPPGLVNAYGRRSPGSGPVAAACLVEHKNRMVRTLQGSDATSTTSVYLSGAAGVLGVTPEWAIVLPDGSSRPIMTVERFYDEDGGTGHFEVLRLQ